MPRKRMIHPDFFTSSTMNELPIATMLTFAGIWTYVDDHGRGEDDAALVKAAVWPRRRTMSEKKVREAMDQLAAAGPVCAYQVAGHALLHVTGWREHQSVSHPAKAKLPPCPTHEADEWEEFQRDTDLAREKFRKSSGGVREDVRNAS